MVLMERQFVLTATLCLDKTVTVMSAPNGEDIRMAGPPSYPDTGTTGQDPGTPSDGERRARRPPWRTAAIVITGIALLVVMVILHLTGTLGAGSHG
jgi:hypothetical protein